jgi:hypothetical protein
MLPAPYRNVLVPAEVTVRQPRVFLHIGAPKTGTTYLQNVLWRNRDALRQAGVLYPGLSKDAQFHAAMDLRQAYFQEHLNPAVPGAWERLVAQARGWRGDVVISHELFSMLDVQVAQDALAHLGWAEVHLVCTARDLARQVPAVWQEDIKNRQVLSFGEFTRELSAPGPATHYLANLFWQMQDIPRVLDTWAATLPPECVHLVTVPPAGAAPDELWSRFSQAIGINSIGGEIDLGCEPNRSMGIAETNLLRRLNLALGDSLDWPAYDVLVKDFLALSVMGAHPSVPLALPLADHEWVGQRARRMVDALSARNWRIIGDLDELIPAPVEQHSRHPDDTTDGELADAAVHALAGLLHWARDHTPPRQPAWRRGAVRISQRHASLRQLRRRYLAVKARRGIHRSR